MTEASDPLSSGRWNIRKMHQRREKGLLAWPILVENASGGLMVVGRHTITCSRDHAAANHHHCPLTNSRDAAIGHRCQPHHPVSTRMHLSTCMTVRSLCPNGDLPLLHWRKPLPVEKAAVGRLNKNQLALGTGRLYRSLQGEIYLLFSPRSH